MTFLNLHYLAILLLLPLVLFLYSYSKQRKSRYYKAMKGQELPRKVWPLIFLIISLTLLTFAVMRPVSNPRVKSVEKKGRNIVFLLDVSRSMLAEDLVPNRLMRAKYDIQEGLSVLDGHRIALVAFAGHPVLKCPLTLDYMYFKQALNDLNSRSVSKGGTNLGDAVRTVIDDLFDPEDRSHMDIILITDGEDQDSFPVESATKAGKAGIRIIAVGLGNQNEGSLVPGDDGAMLYEDEPVYSKADLPTLEQMAQASKQGWLISVENGRIPFKQIINDLDRAEGQKNTTSIDEYQYDEHYRLFLLPALLFLFLFLMGEENLIILKKKRTAE